MSESRSGQHLIACADSAKKLSPVEVARAALGRVAAWEKKINAMYVVDAEGALAAAASEARWRARKTMEAQRDRCRI